MGMRSRIVGTGQIEDDAVTAAKIAAGAVGTSELATGGVATADLADDAVTADKLRDDAATDANRAVTTDHIRDLAVTNAKIAAVAASKLTGTVATAQIADEAVTAAKIAGAWLTAPASPVRAFATTYTPNATRPTLVVITVSIEVDKGGDGLVELLVEDVDPPTVKMCDAQLKLTDADGVNARSILAHYVLMAIVPAGHEYRVNTTNVAGTPSFSLTRTREWTL